MNITTLQSIAAPILAPVAPAVLFGNNLYHGMVTDAVNPTLAGIAAIGGTIGVELSGALACSMAVMAYHKRDYKIMFLSIGASVIYAGFVYQGIASARNSATFAGAVVISLIAYLMLGVYQSYTAKRDAEKAETDNKVAALDAERKLVNARTRAAKGVPAAVVQPSTVSVHVGQFQIDPAKIAAIQAYWQANPQASLRTVAAACGCSPMTAGKYKP